MGEPNARNPSVEDILTLQRDAIAGLIRSPALGSGDVEAALIQITEAAARLLDVRRASVWRFDERRTRIDCLDLYDAQVDRHERGASLGFDLAPAYFEAAVQERCITAHDALADPRTREFGESYLIPLGITSMLDAPVIVRGRLIGVVCHEHVGPQRAWTAREELLAGTLADFVGMTLSASEHATQARELAVLKSDLERRVDLRTRELAKSRENVRAVFETSPVPIVLTSLADGSVVLANASAAALFGVPLEAVNGETATSFYADSADRDSVMEAIRTKGRVDGVEVMMRNAQDEPFWASLSATVIEFEDELTILGAIHDITDMKRAERTLRRSEEMLRTLLAAAPVPLVVTGRDDATILFSNERAAETFGTVLEDFVGRPATSFYVDPEERSKLLEEVAREGGVDGFATRVQTVDGKAFWALLSARPAILDGEDVVIVGITDLTTQKEIEQRLRELATLDPLTGVYNRRHFFEVADATLTIADRHHKAACVAMLDIDHFKEINDQHGHLVGDEVLRWVTRVAREAIRSSDVLARYGGEEFVLLLPELEISAAQRIVERIRGVVADQTLETEDGPVSVTLSAGVTARAPEETIESLIRRADHALYEAKHAGRNRTIAG